MTEKLETKLEQVEIKQTRDKVEPIRFKDDAINKIKKDNYNFGKKRFKYIPFKVSKDSHHKGLLLKIFKGKVGENWTDKSFCVRFWFNGRANIHWLGRVSPRFGVKECNETLIEVVKKHTDPKTGYWIKDPNKTVKDEKRIVEKPDTTRMMPLSYTMKTKKEWLN